MGFWDRFRRDGGRPAEALPQDWAGNTETPRPEGAWDGGWRRVAPPVLTIARAPIGVSDGLRFRSGLAAWQSLAVGSGLGHALLPSAPVGLIHGVTRPVTPGAASGGGPLLLRVAQPERESGADQPGGDGASPVHPPNRATPAGPGPGTPAGPSAAGSRRAGPAAVRPRPTGPPLTVARRPAMPARAINAIPLSAGHFPATAAATGTTEDATAVSGVPAAVTAQALQAGPAASVAGPAVSVVRPGATGASEPVKPAPADSLRELPVRGIRLGEPLGELPAGATPLSAMDRTVTPGSAPAARAGSMPVLQRLATPGPSGPPVQSGGHGQTGPSGPARPSGQPSLSEPPAPEESARRSERQGGARASAPSRPPERPEPAALPSRPRPARSGIGAPLAALPSTATASGSAPLLGDHRQVQRKAEPTLPNPVPGNGSVVAPASAGPTEPVSPSHVSVVPPMPVRAAAVEPPIRATSAGLPAVQRSVVAGRDAEPAAERGPARAAPSAGRSERTRRSGNSMSDNPMSGGAASPHSPGPALRTSPDDKRTVARRAPERGRLTSDSGVRLEPSPPATGSAEAVSAVQRSRALLAERPLMVSTGASEGFFSAPAPASRAVRPVVAATWRRDVRSARATGPSPLGPGSVPHVQRSSSGPGAAPAKDSGRKPARPAVAPPPALGSPTAPASPAARAAPLAPASPTAAVTSLSGPGPAVQRSVPARPPAPDLPVSRSDDAPVFAVPVVRPALVAAGGPGTATAPVQRLPMTTHAAQALASGPAPGFAATARADTPSLPVRIVRRTETRRTEAPPMAAPRPAAAGPTAQALQRTVADAGFAGVPVAAVPAREAATAQPATAQTPAPPARGAQAGEQAAGIEIEELARRLIEPVARLLRADLRRGRERAGRLYDGRR